MNIWSYLCAIIAWPRRYHRDGNCPDFSLLDSRVEKPAFSARVYRMRNKIERFFNRIKHFRAIATRFDKHDANYIASLKIVAMRIWISAL